MKSVMTPIILEISPPREAIMYMSGIMNRTAIRQSAAAAERFLNLPPERSVR